MLLLSSFSMSFYFRWDSMISEGHTQTYGLNSMLKGFRNGYYGALVIMATISFEKVEVVMLEISYLIDVLRYLKVYFGLL